MGSRLRAYTLTHYARVEITTVVAAHSAKEAEEQWRSQTETVIDEGWSGEGEPSGRAVARRAPDFDHLIENES